MGLMDKLKAAKNYVTGGAAELDVQVGDAIVGESFPIKIVATIKDADLEVDRVYLKVRACEMEDRLEVCHHAGGGVSAYETVDKFTTFRLEIDIDEGQVLNANETYEWEGEIEIPEDQPPTYFEPGAAHQWFILAGLDSAGNDPDSGWLEFDVSE